MLPITWLQGNKPNDDFIRRSRSLRFFTRAYIIDANTAIVSNIQTHWYSFMHSTLRLVVFNGSGQNHITNKLNFTTAIAFFSVTFFCVTMLNYVQMYVQIYYVCYCWMGIISRDVEQSTILELTVKCWNYNSVKSNLRNYIPSWKIFLHTRYTLFQ